MKIVSNNSRLNGNSKSRFSVDDLELKLAKAREYENAENYFSAAIYYKETLEMAVKLQDSKSIKLCKTKLVEMNKKSIASDKDFNQIEVPFDLSPKEQANIDTFIEKIRKIDNAKLLLKVIGESPEFIPNYRNIEKQSKQSIPISHQLATLTTISNDGHNLQGGSLGKYAWFTQIYDMNQKLILEFMLSKLVQMLISNGKGSGKVGLVDMKEYFTESRLIPSDNLEIILIGLEKYFSEDYVSALHILIPQFEAFFLSLAQRCGINTIALNRGVDISTSTTTLSEIHLDSKEFKDVFGEDFCRQVKFVLFEPMGYKFRHKIAHGEIRLAECNFSNTTLILYFYLVLLARTKPKSQTP